MHRLFYFLRPYRNFHPSVFSLADGDDSTRSFIITVAFRPTPRNPKQFPPFACHLGPGRWVCEDVRGQFHRLAYAFWELERALENPLERSSHTLLNPRFKLQHQVLCIHNTSRRMWIPSLRVNSLQAKSETNIMPTNQERMWRVIVSVTWQLRDPEGVYDFPTVDQLR